MKDILFIIAFALIVIQLGGSCLGMKAYDQLLLADLIIILLLLSK